MTTRIQRSPIPLLLGISLFLIGIGAAAVTPYRAIVAIDDIGLDRSTFAAVMTIGSVAGALGSMALGAWADHVRDRRPLALVCVLVGTLGYALVWLLPTRISLILSYAAFLPFATAALSQTYSYTRAWYDEHRPGSSDRAMSVLRSAFSLSWVIMPPVAGWLAARTSAIDTFGLAGIASLAALLAFFALILRRDGTTTRPQPLTSGTRSAFPVYRRVGVLGAFLLRVPVILHTMTLPILLTHDLGATLGQVGINAALAAALEVPMMVGWGWMIGRMGKERILGITGLLFALYLVLMARATTVGQAYALQVLNAVALSALLSITISYLQDAIRDRVGLSTSLLDAVTVLATLVASAMFGFWQTGGGYQPLFDLGAVFAVIGAVIVWASPRLAR